MADKADKRVSGGFLDDKVIDLEDLEPAGMTQEELIEPSYDYRTDARSASVTLAQEDLELCSKFKREGRAEGR